jgi:hypothetical protein
VSASANKGGQKKDYSVYPRTDHAHRKKNLLQAENGLLKILESYKAIQAHRGANGAQPDRCRRHKVV